MASNPKSPTRVKRIVAEIQAKINAERLSPGAQLPSERDLAKVYGVSQSTAKKALGQLKAEGLVRGWQGKGNFVVERTIRQPRRVTKTIAVMIEQEAHFNHPVMSQRLQGVQSVLSPLGWHLAIMARNASAPVSHGGLWDEGTRISPTLIDGAMVLDGSYDFDHEPCHRLSDHLPVVVGDAVLREERNNLYAVSIDYSVGIFTAIHHLLDLGHRSIALLLYRRGQMMSARMADAARMAISCHPMGTMAVLKSTYCLEFTAEESRVAVSALMSGPLPPTAFIGAHDFVPGIYQALSAKGLEIPDDASVVVVNDVIPESAYGLSFSTIHVDYKDSGKACAEVLLEAMEGRKPLPETYIPSKFIRRASTTAVASK